MQVLIIFPFGKIVNENFEKFLTIFPEMILHCFNETHLCYDVMLFNYKRFIMMWIENMETDTPVEVVIKQCLYQQAMLFCYIWCSTHDSGVLTTLRVKM